MHCNTVMFQSPMLSHKIICGLQLIGASLVTIYKAFIRPHLDFNDAFYQKMETAQFGDALTGTIRGTSRNFRGEVFRRARLRVSEVQ